MKKYIKIKLAGDVSKRADIEWILRITDSFVPGCRWVLHVILQRENNLQINF
jgi:hypothetical protein